MVEGELEKETDFATAAVVWNDDKGLEVDSYYISPLWFIPAEATDFIREVRWNEKFGKSSFDSYWGQSARFVEAQEQFNYFVDYWKSGVNKQGFS